MSQSSIAPLEALLVRLQAQWGSASLRPLRSLPTPTAPALPFGYDLLDAALGGGLLPGRLTEVVGQPTAGMSTLLYELVAQTQSAGEYVLWIDLPGTFDPVAADRCDIVLERLVLLRLDAPEDAFTILRELLLAGDLRLIVLDFGNDQPDWEGLRRLVGILTRAGSALVSCRDLLPGRQPGENPLAAARLFIERHTWLRTGQTITGCRSRVTLLKGAVTRTHYVDLDIHFGVP